MRLSRLIELLTDLFNEQGDVEIRIRKRCAQTGYVYLVPLLPKDVALRNGAITIEDFTDRTPDVEP